jgi:hypothetical protein
MEKLKEKKTTLVIWVHVGGMGTCDVDSCICSKPRPPRFLEKIRTEKQTKY